MNVIDTSAYINFERTPAVNVMSRIKQEVWLAAKAAGVNRPEFSVSCTWLGRQCEVAIRITETGAVPFDGGVLSQAMVVNADAVAPTTEEEGV